MSEHEPKTLLEATEDLHRACRAVFVEPFLPPLTRICATLIKWVEWLEARL